MGHEIGEMSRFVEGQLQLSNTVKRPGAFAGKAPAAERRRDGCMEDLVKRVVA